MDPLKVSDTTPSETLGRVATRLIANAKANDGVNHQDADDRRRRLQVTAKLAAQLGERYSPSRCSLDTFQTYHAAQKTALRQLRGVLSDVAAFVADGRSLVLFGAVGTGKDHLLASALYAACEAGIIPSWANGQDVFGKFRDAMDTGVREETILAALVEPQLLAISDPIPPSQKLGDYNVMQFYRVLDRRYRSLRATWVSLNAINEKDADAKLSAPVFDRLRENAVMVPCFWPSFRERMAQEPQKTIAPPPSDPPKRAKGR